MLLLTKKYIRLQVYGDLPRVRILPLAQSREEERLVATIARNEELLAGVYLSIAGPHDQQKQLVNYFTHRGWQVQQV